MAVWVVTYITCTKCGHRNLPHPKPIEAAIMLVQGWERECYGCGRMLYYKKTVLDRPIYRRALAIIEQREAEAANQA